MAKRKRNIIEIDVGDLIVYKWKGIDSIRLKGNTGRQAPVAKKQAAILGRAAALGARIRAVLTPVLPAPLKRPLLNRFNYAIQQWLRLGQITETSALDNIPFITGFSFYGGAADAEYLSHFSVKRTGANGLALHITDLDPSAYSGVLSSGGIATLHIIVASCNVTDLTDTRSAELTVDISYTANSFHSQSLALPGQTSPGTISIVAISTNDRNVIIAGAMYN